MTHNILATREVKRMAMKPSRLVLAALILSSFSCVAAVDVQVPSELPIFDAHIHYSRDAWDALSPDQALDILDRAGVRWALVSSTPDDGTLKLHKLAPHRIIPFLRPYRSSGDMASWHSDPALQAYVEERLQQGPYKGIGEFHLSATDTDGPVVKRFAELAARHQLFFHAHVDEAAVEQLLTLYPQVRILWAHAGMSSPVQDVRRLLDRYPKLWVELSMRLDVAPGGTLDAEWRAIFMRHPDRFMVGTDTWVPSRWQTLVAEMRTTRGWLSQLPRDVAEQIAYRNGERLFGSP